MSQFTQKYYKQNYTPSNEKVWVWEFWRRWGLYEYLVLFLLILILLCVCTKTGSGHDTANTNAALHTATVNSGKTVRSPSDKPKDERPELATRSYPVKVLPSDPLPKKRVTTKEGQTLYGPVTIEEYLYFADDTQSHYPEFMDPLSRHVYLRKSPQCARLSCPIKGLRPVDEQAYLEWVNRQSKKEMVLKKNSDGYYLMEKK